MIEAANHLLEFNNWVVAGKDPPELAPKDAPSCFPIVGGVQSFVYVLFIIPVVVVILDKVAAAG